MRSILSVVRLAKLKAREAPEGSFMGIPSIRTLVWAELLPRRNREVSDPAPPFWLVLIPVRFRKASSRVVVPCFFKSSEVMTSTLAPVVLLLAA